MPGRATITAPTSLSIADRLNPVSNFKSCAARPNPGSPGPFIIRWLPHPTAAVATITSTCPTRSPMSRP